MAPGRHARGMVDGVLCRPSPKRQSGRGGAGLDLVELDRRLAVRRGLEGWPRDGLLGLAATGL